MTRLRFVIDVKANKWYVKMASIKNHNGFYPWFTYLQWPHLLLSVQYVSLKIIYNKRQDVVIENIT